ncbi:MAG: sugar-binding domain-containing protein [Amaricoccus sp.]
MSLEGPEDSDAFVVEVCWHYYVNEMTQAQVASMLGVTRLRVNQAIQKAKSLGMVKVQIESPFLTRVALQERLREHLGIPKVLVAPARRDGYDYHVPTGAALADHLAECLRVRRWKSVGVSWGMTLQAAIERMPRLSCPDLEIVSIVGGATAGASFNAFGIASGFAERLGARYSLLPAPVLLPEGASREALLAQESLAEHMHKCEAIDAAVLVVGDISSRSYLISTGLPRDVAPEDLTAAGAVGDLLGRFLAEDGSDACPALAPRTVGIDLAQLARVPEKILAAAGPHKVAIIRAVARRGLIDTLITDDVTAELLLEPPGPPAVR